MPFRDVIFVITGAFNAKCDAILYYNRLSSKQIPSVEIVFAYNLISSYRIEITAAKLLYKLIVSWKRRSY